MGIQAASRLIMLAVVCAVLECPAIHAQLQRLPERCSLGSSGAENRDGKIPGQVIIIDGVEFDGSIHLSEAAREKLVSELKQRRFRAGSKWINEIEEVAVRGAWQDEGFFTAMGQAKAQVLYVDAEAQHVSLKITVDEGPQYRLADVQFRPADPETHTALFSPEELRRAIPLFDGDLFNVSKIREGLDALRRLYTSKGYIDFTAGPVTDVDDARQLISLTIELDEQKQFRIGKVEILGLNQMTESVLRSKLKPGDVFNFQIVEDFYEDNRSVLPPDASPTNGEVRRNVKEGTVDLTFDFRSCPTSRD